MRAIQRCIQALGSLTADDEHAYACFVPLGVRFMTNTVDTAGPPPLLLLALGVSGTEERLF